jgi:hypothetical protein
MQNVSPTASNLILLCARLRPFQQTLRPIKTGRSADPGELRSIRPLRGALRFVLERGCSENRSTYLAAFRACFQNGSVSVRKPQRAVSVARSYRSGYLHTPYKSSYGTLASGVCSVKGINSHINEMEFKFLIETIFIGYKPIKLFIPLV